METTKLKSIAINFLLAVILLFIGGFLNEYLFKDKPELTYNLYESDPIETESGTYHSTSVRITNSGDTPLSSVKVFLKFSGMIVKETSNIYGGKIDDDSLNIKREFRMPTNSYIQIRVTSKGNLESIHISSAEVLATKRDDVVDDKKTLSTLYIILIISFFLGFALYIQTQELNKIKKKLAKSDSEK